MDTDYDLPVPMHRPFIHATSQYDSPLPFRRELEQVTELTAENSAPYTPKPPPKPRSTFESLPYEIRQVIWGHLGIENNARVLERRDDFIEGNVPTSSNYRFSHTPARQSDWTDCDRDTVRSVTSLCTSLRHEVLDILFDGARLAVDESDVHDRTMLINTCSGFVDDSNSWGSG
jgi:hypothetical protein